MAKAIPVPAAEATALRGGRWHWFAKHAKRQVIPRIVLIAVCALFVLPFYWMVVTALKSNPDLVAYPPTVWPTVLRWANFAEAVDLIPFWRYLGNTSLITGLTIVGSVLSNPLIAYGFSRIEWPGRDKVFYLVLATVFIPFPVLIVALFDMFARLGWINTILPLVVPMFFGQAFWIFLMRQFLLRVPQEVSDAARIDGASEFRIFAQIVLPQALPAIGVISIFAALFAWNDFLGPLIYLHDQADYTLAIGLTFFRSQRDLQFNLLMAASVLVVLPVVVFFLFFQRAFVEGISLGSLK